ncbi:cytochrome c-type biogenesis protein CcmE [Tepidamorphus gemmatus]|jgi:cytochrome c-type biogenesis protein CcmE|uniref:Cytochrome c-type biogenesis protein CcmE n=1 Tax=Tepidamorphus gemmatus TaxID=747076 RepID=A0A4R3M5W7_9HYPH|nr:cytochrome c maturation protein CcmE [Tepidamorphus gemmatus]TCT08700.1 cytochrome c-type biogenesis protein CcmE [Tepidamorphus gemmatus]
MTRKQRRLMLIGMAGLVLFAAVGLVLAAFRDTIVFFNSPSDVIAGNLEPGKRIRLGGLVEDGSFVRKEGMTVEFTVTDTANAIRVVYTGLLPDLFREGQGVVTEGAMAPDGTFLADTVLAKHDETYMPREVADALKKQGHWMGEEAER